MKPPVQQKRTVVGIISDTHGSITQEALNALKGVNYIIHAGDIVSDEIIADLEKLAPLIAIRGNMDAYGIPRRLSKTEYTKIAGVAFYILHDIMQLDLDPVTAGISIVIHGHTHRPEIQWKGDVLYLNPGSAATPRGGHPPSVAKITIEAGKITPEIIRL